MSDQPLDRWRERMVAALYGELSAAERQELEEKLASDEALRHDREELAETRAAQERLTAAARSDEAPLSWETPLPARPQGHPALSWRARAAFRHLPAAGLGFAAAATLFLALLLAGLRVDRTGAGLLVHLEREPGATALPTGDPTGSSPGPAPLPYLTRDEFAAFADLLLASTAGRLDQLERRQVATQTEVARTLYDALAVTQQRQYQDLRSRIELAVYRPERLRGQDASLPNRKPSTP